MAIDEIMNLTASIYERCRLSYSAYDSEIEIFLRNLKN
jgi:hypothetical protein